MDQGQTSSIDCMFNLNLDHTRFIRAFQDQIPGGEIERLSFDQSSAPGFIRLRLRSSQVDQTALLGFFQKYTQDNAIVRMRG